MGLLLRVEGLELHREVEDAENVDNRVTDSSSAKRCSASTARDLGIANSIVRKGRIEHKVLQHPRIHLRDLELGVTNGVKLRAVLRE